MSSLNLASAAFYIAEKNGHVYVSVGEQGIKCSCDEWQYRKQGSAACPHVLLVLNHIDPNMFSERTRNFITKHWNFAHYSSSSSIKHES
jgi:hypothetical protein